MVKTWKQLSSLIATAIINPLVRLSLKWHLFIFKSAVNIRQLLALKLASQIRLAIPEARLEGYDDEVDELVHLVKLRLTYPEIFDGEKYKFLVDGSTDELKKKDHSLRDAYESKKEKVDAILDRIRKDQTVNDTVRNHWLMQHLLETLKPNAKPQILEHYLASARNVYPAAQPLSLKDLTELRKQTKRDIAELRELISDRNAIKISWSVTDTTSLLGVISPFFLFTGYLYNHFLLGEFGIEVSKYFRLTDYISSSIEGIRYSFVGAAIGMLSVFLGMHNWSRQSGFEKNYQKGRTEYWYYALWATGAAGIFIGYMRNLESFYGATSVTFLLVCFHFAPKLARKYFIEPLKPWFTFLFIGYFCAYMFLSIGTDTYKFKNYDFSKLTTHDVKFKDSYPMKETQLILLAGNSDYFFFLDRQRKPLIVPRVEVIQLRPNLP